VVPRNLANADFVAAGARLILVDVFESKIGAKARLGPDTYGVPIGIERTERGSACGVGSGLRKREQSSRGE
jgi:hypothetical protein